MTTKPEECKNGCPENQACDYCQYVRVIERQAAQIEMMRESLEFMWRDVPMNDYAFEKCEKALSTTPDQALEQFAAKVREQCATHFEQRPHTELFGDAISAEIRAIKELP